MPWCLSEAGKKYSSGAVPQGCFSYFGAWLGRIQSGSLIFQQLHLGIWTWSAVRNKMLISSLLVISWLKHQVLCDVYYLLPFSVDSKVHDITSIVCFKRLNQIILAWSYWYLLHLHLQYNGRTVWYRNRLP